MVVSVEFSFTLIVSYMRFLLLELKIFSKIG